MWYDFKWQCHRSLPETLLDPMRYADVLRLENENENENENARSRKAPSKRGLQEFDSHEIAYLVRAVGVPVFRVLGCEGHADGKRRMKIDGHAPILKDIVGFTAKYPPEIVWQGIYTTLTSVLRTDPDKAPPAQVNEKIRIEYAGFDLKSSFRHPVNSPAAAAKRKSR